MGRRMITTVSRQCMEPLPCYITHFDEALHGICPPNADAACNMRLARLDASAKERPGVTTSLAVSHWAWRLQELDSEPHARGWALTSLVHK